MNQYRCQVAAPLEGFDLFQYVDRTKHTKYFGKTSQFAVAATSLALKDAGIELQKNEDGEEDLHGHIGKYHLKGLDSFQGGVILGIGGPLVLLAAAGATATRG